MAFNPEDRTNNVIGDVVTNRQPVMKGFFGSDVHTLANAIMKFENSAEDYEKLINNQHTQWNNPGNLIYKEGIAGTYKRKDQKVTDLRVRGANPRPDGKYNYYMKFNSPQEGYDALVKQLERYASGKNTVDKNSPSWTIDDFIERYAPTGQDNTKEQTDNYKKHIKRIIMAEIDKHGSNI